MSEMPTCTKCQQPHWRFKPCAEAPALIEKEQARARARVIPEASAPPGYVKVGPGKFARIDADRPGVAADRTHIEIAPGKYGLAKNYVVLPGGKYARKEIV